MYFSFWNFRQNADDDAVHYVVKMEKSPENWQYVCQIRSDTDPVENLSPILLKYDINII